MMHRAIGIGADLTQLAFLAAISNDSLRHVLARLVLRRVRLVFVFRLLLPDFDILISRYNRATFDTFAVGIVICTSLGFAATVFFTCASTFAASQAVLQQESCSAAIPSKIASM